MVHGRGVGGGDATRGLTKDLVAKCDCGQE